MELFKAEIDYSSTALAPVISSEIVDYHYGKHHVGYANSLNSLLVDTKYVGMSLEQIIIASRNGNCALDAKIFNNAAQLFNHNFYWKCLKLGIRDIPSRLNGLIVSQYQSVDSFINEYYDKAVSIFGSGWSWLIFCDGGLSFLNASNAETPVGTGMVPICVLDVWEHAYYLDYKNNRAAYLERLLSECINWEFCESQLPKWAE